MRPLLPLLLASLACGGPSSPATSSGTTPPTTTTSPVAASGPTTTTTTTTTATTTTTPTSSPSAPTSASGPAPQPSVTNAPEITKSAGQAGGVVILWPRIPGHAKDADSRALAAKIQERLRVIAARAYPGKPIDVRPEPERVCGRQGCTAIAVGAALLRSGGGCAVIATVTAGGTSPTTVVPWVGQLELKSATVAFREPPEPAVVVHDFENCGKVEEVLGAREAAVETAVRAGK